MSTHPQHTPRRTHPLRAGLCVLAAASLVCSPAQAAISLFNFSGSTDSGVHAGATFSGSFAFADSTLTPGFSGNVPLGSFVMDFLGQSYTLAGADTPAQAVFAAGTLVGLDYADTANATSMRPRVALVAGFTSVTEAYLAYEPIDTNLLPGFGSYSITAVPEPASLALMLAGLAGLATVAKRRGAF